MADERSLFSTIRLSILIAVLAVIALAVYSVRAHYTAERMSAQNQQLAAALDQTQKQMDELNTKLNALSVAAPPPSPAVVAPSRRNGSHFGRSAQRRRADDPRWKQIQNQLAEQGKQIDSTRQDLTSTRTELQGSIARTHDELVVLQRKGERNYYEFDLDKSKQFRSAGALGLKLRKANTKHQYADLELLVDDVNLSKKHVNLYEPVSFYAADSQQPLELVINSISKNHIHGYVSEPRYKRSELTAMAAGANTTTDANAGNNGATAANASTSGAPLKTRRRLELPQ